MTEFGSCALAGPVLAIALSAVAGDATAQNLPDAVGRVSPVDAQGVRVGDAICTGVLVAPDLVLTAGHCLPANSSGARFAFDAGLGDGKAVVRAYGSRFERFDERPLGPLKLDNDLALLRLDAAIDGGRVEPLARGAALPLSAVVFAYDRARPDDRPIATRCNRLAQWPEDDPRVVAFDCKVVSGNSGAPLLIETAEGWQIVAIMVARGSAPLNAFAAIPPADDRW